MSSTSSASVELGGWLLEDSKVATVQENEYDGRGFRIVKQEYTTGTLTETRHYYYSNNWQVLEERLDNSTTPDRQFVCGQRYIDELILRDRTTTSTLNERLYALQDGNWNVTTVVDDTGTPQERYEYDPYGVTTVLSPTFTPKAASDFGWEITYCGYTLEAEVDLFQVRRRYYSPSGGAWASRDPIGYKDGSNLYEFVASSPISLVDPMGTLKAFTTCRGVGGGFTFTMGGSVAALYCFDTRGNWAYILNVRPSVGVGAGVGGQNAHYTGCLPDVLKKIYVDFEVNWTVGSLGADVSTDGSSFGGHGGLAIINGETPNIGIEGTIGVNISANLGDSRLPKVTGPLSDLSHPCEQGEPFREKKEPTGPRYCSPPVGPNACDACCLEVHKLTPGSPDYFACVDFCEDNAGCEEWYRKLDF